jgi:hypothetical protein
MHSNFKSAFLGFHDKINAVFPGASHQDNTVAKICGVVFEIAIAIEF